MPNTTLTGLVDRLIELFTPIFDEWKKAHPTEPPATLRECLRQDLLSIGQAVASLDNTGHRVETRLIAEVLAALQENNSLPYEYRLEAIDREISARPSNSSLALCTAAIAREWKASAPVREDAIHELVGALTALVNYLVLYDGKVSNREIGFFGELEKQFSG